MDYFHEMVLIYSVCFSTKKNISAFSLYYWSSLQDRKLLRMSKVETLLFFKDVTEIYPTIILKKTDCAGIGRSIVVLYKR